MRVIVGVTGGIAAYKVAEVVRGLVKAGHEVQVVMTEAARAFVTPLTFQALSGRPVRDSLLDPEAEQGMGHIELARWADRVLVAPATADVIARLNAGLADDLLTTLVLATRAPVILAPAMNQAMWSNPVTQRNLQSLRQAYPNLEVLGPASGEQACGDVGPGRMLEPADLLAGLLGAAGQASTPPRTDTDLSGVRLLLTAGPTRERIDPVRYISNDSSGRMGFALAQAAARRGASVVLVAGPVPLATPEGVQRIDVESARQMQAAVEGGIAECDIFIASAAVADYRPADSSPHKLKKQGSHGLTLSLVQNPDILAGVAGRAEPPFTVGFAAETQALEQHAREKLERKRVHMIIGNNVARQDIGFNSEYNEVIVVTPSSMVALPRQRKAELADVLLDHIVAAWRTAASSKQGV